MSALSACSAARRGSFVPPLSGVDEPSVPHLPDQCDVLICGTGLAESILAAALAWQGTRVFHIDSNSYYGDANAVLGLEELKAWVVQVNKDTSPNKTFSQAQLYMPRDLPRHSKFLIDLTPKFLFAKSDLLDVLVKCRIYKYLDFKPLGSFHTYENDTFEKVPGTKEDIFTSQTLSLTTKRKLMKFVKFVLVYDKQPQVWTAHKDVSAARFLSEVFELGDKEIAELVLTIGLCETENVPTHLALEAVRRYLVSLDIYGNFPALYSMYGGAGELAQGFCRSAAVAGTTYKLRTGLDSFDEQTRIAHLSDGSHVCVCVRVVTGQSRTHKTLGHKKVTRLVTIVGKDCAEWYAPGQSAAVVIFPPRTIASNNQLAVQCQVMGPGTGMCPENHAIWYLHTVEEDSKKAAADLEAALQKLEQSILREATQDFEFDQLEKGDVTYRADGLPVISSIKLGQSLQNFVPREKLSYLVKLMYVQRVDDDSEKVDPASPILYTKRPSPHVTFDGVISETKQLYQAIVGSDDDFFDVDFEDEDSTQRAPSAQASPAVRGGVSSDFVDHMEL